ncbi:MAG TPA: ATP-dependent helicase [Polyangia bacterium]|nr:ATP-dependent helicase [Polyangia bacterium]
MSSAAAAAHDALATLNDAQRAAVVHEAGPLLIIAGAGSGKTNTLAHRVAHLIERGADPRRILLLTFSRRAAAEMTARAQRLLSRAQTTTAAPSLSWSGTFHAVANRLLRLHAADVGFDPAFTVLDRSDAADALDVVRHDLDLATAARRFPKKGTCLAIYSRAVNAQEPLATTLKDHFPWCAEHADALRRLFAAYVEQKQRQHVLDYDDLLLYWLHFLEDDGVAARMRRRFDHFLVDEYQDTNALQAQILARLSPDGRGVTVVGDDAQSIYAFRAATVRNILDFPARFSPPARVVTLVENYRSTQPILDAANAVIAYAAERFTKNLFSRRAGADKPRLVCALDEDAQVDYVVTEILTAREAGVPLKRQAVLFRASHHSDALEVELARRNVPFVKFGGLKFLEAAHVKDTLCLLRWSENLRDRAAAFRVLQLLPGVGPSTAQRATTELQTANFALAALVAHTPPPSARADWPVLCELMARLRGDVPWAAQLGLVRRWYEPHLGRIYDHANMRAQDLDQLEQIAVHYPSRERFLSELTLDPPSATGDQAGPPLRDEDYLILSTIHSAKGQEWDNVFVLNCSDGSMPSDLATGSPEQLDEERRLFYVALTRAREQLHVIHPQRFFVRQQRKYGDTHVYAPRTRFIPDAIVDRFARVSHGIAAPADEPDAPAPARLDLGARLRERWTN